MNARLLAALAAIVVLGGGSIAYIWLRSANEVEAERESVLRAVDAELDRPDLDREGATRVLGQVERLLDPTDPSPPARLVRARGWLQLALGRSAAAWETMSGRVSTPDNDPEDGWLGARILARLHDELGERTRGTQALALAREHYRRTNLVEPGFLAWQLAYRLDEVEAWLELGASLRSDHGDTLEAATVVAIEHFLALHIADRIGIEVDEARIRELAESTTADPTARALCRHALDTAAAAMALSEGELLELERRFGHVPPELSVVLARGEIARAERVRPDSEEDSRRHLETAADILRTTLATHPTLVEARHLAAIVQRALGNVTQQHAHLRWLLQNAAEVDARRSAWTAQLRG